MSRRRPLKTLIAAGAACLLVVLMLRWFEHSQVYHPVRALAVTGAELGRPVEQVIFQTSDGLALHGWFYPALTNSPRRHLALLFCHGNGGNISHRLETYAALLQTGVSVFAFDYRGYGKSQGAPTERGTYEDAQAAYRWLRQQGFAATNIVAFGESLGGAVATELAVREPLGGLVLQSTFTSIPAMGAELFPWLPVRWMSTIRYDTHSKLPRVHLPVLVMHSREDDLVAFHHAQDNYAAANPPKLFCELRGSHNNSLADQSAFIRGLDQFLSLLASAPGGPGSAPTVPGK
jgi:uncharacterized protein